MAEPLTIAPDTAVAARREAADTARPRLAGTRLTVHAALADCEQIWREALDACAGFVFQTYEWHAAWLATIGAAERVSPHIVHLADSAGRTLLLLPLAIHREGRLRVLRFLGGLVTDYNAPLIEPGFAAALGPGDTARLWADIMALLPRVDLVRLRRMPETIEGVRNPFVALPGARHAENAYAAALPASLAEFRDGRSARLFKDNRRTLRRLADKGPVAFFEPNTPDLLDATFAAMTRQKSRRWRETGHRDWFEAPGYRDFYRMLVDRLLPGGRVRLDGLRVGDEIVATKLGTVFRGRYCDLISGFEAGDWARLSLGRVLLEHVVAQCIAAPDIGVYDLTGGEEAYKQRWTDHSMRLYEYLAPHSLAGAGVVAAHRLRQWLRRDPRLRRLVRRLRGRKPE